jgi:hypothetical protein
MFSGTAKFAHTEGYDLEEMGEELVLYHEASETIFHCNAAAALVYRLVDGSRSVDDVVAMIVEAYPDASSRIREDVASAIDALVVYGAIAEV